MINRRKLFKSLGGFLVFPQLLQAKPTRYWHVFNVTNIADTIIDDNVQNIFLCPSNFLDKKLALADITKQYSKIYKDISYRYYVGSSKDGHKSNYFTKKYSDRLNAFLKGV